jgi:putative IMPACT (imprinted ancient) family translation regulator
MGELFTLQGEARLQQDIRKSRFLAQAITIVDTESAAGFITRVGAVEATHHCWAWRIGASYRFNDDGEPGGSAGRPILGAIDGQGFDRVVVVVTRWYGGVKLGVGGLARAYGGCAAECLRLAPRIAIVERVQARIHCAFADAPMLYARLRDFDARRVDESASAEGVIVSIEVARQQLTALAAFVRDLTRGRGLLEPAP